MAASNRLWVLEIERRGGMFHTTGPITVDGKARMCGELSYFYYFLKIFKKEFFLEDFNKIFWIYTPLSHTFWYCIAVWWAS